MKSTWNLSEASRASYAQMILRHRPRTLGSRMRALRSLQLALGSNPRTTGHSRFAADVTGVSTRAMSGHSGTTLELMPVYTRCACSLSLETMNKPRTYNQPVPRHSYQWKLSFSFKSGLLPGNKYA